MGVPDAPSAPDAACTPTVVQLLTNSNLDSGPGGGWVESGAGYPIILSPSDPTYPLPVTPHTGNYAAWLGGLPSSIRALYQDVAIPAGATNISVSGYYLIATEEYLGVYDYLRITIRNTSNTQLALLATYDNEDDTLESWVSFPLFAADFAGQTIRVHFESDLDSIDNTNFFLDSFTLNATVCQ